MLNNRFLIFILLLIIPALVKAQDDNFKVWNSIIVKKNLNKWELSTELELRETGFYRKTERASFKVEAAYDLSKTIQVGSSYTIMSFYDQKFEDYQLRNRFKVTAQGKVKLNRFSATLREQLEYTSKDESDRLKESGEIDTYRINPDLTWRNRLKINYDVPKIPLVPSVAFESFYQLNNPDGNIFEKFRYTIALAYKFTKNHELELFNHINQELEDPESVTNYVLGLGYSYSF